MLIRVILLFVIPINPYPNMFVPGSTPNMILSNSFKKNYLIISKYLSKNTLFISLPVFVVAIGYIFFTIKNQQNILYSIVNNLSLDLFPFLFMVLIFQFINWILEAIKLNILLIGSDKYNFIDIVKAIYAGNLTALITPKRLGNFIGRSWILNNKANHIITASVSGNISQLFATVLMAFMAFIALNFYKIDPLNLFDSYFLILSFIYGFILIFLSFILFNKKWYKVFDQFNFLVFMKKPFKYLKNIVLVKRFQILLISIARYFIFIMQYYILFLAFNIPVEFADVAIFVAVLFGLVTFIPSIAPGNLGTREALSIFILGGSVIGIQLSSIAFIVWVFNVLISALIGGFFLLNKNRKQ